MGSMAPRRAVEAFSRGVHSAPALSNNAAAWGGLAVCEWELPYLDGFELAENDDFIIAHHSAGSQRVRAACNGPWSNTTSVPGLVSVIPPGRRVEYRIDGEVCFSSIHIPRELIEGLSLSPFFGEAGFRFAFHDDFASNCLSILVEQARRSTACQFPYVHAVTRALLLHLMQNAPAMPREDARLDDMGRSARKLDRMLDFIDAHLTEPLKLEDLADHVGVSRAHFARRFREVTGLSPHRYVMQRRIERAKLLLRDGADSLAAIALDLGFSNQSHFTQSFHATTGCTPSQFRRDSRRAVN